MPLIFTRYRLGLRERNGGRRRVMDERNRVPLMMGIPLQWEAA
jgi:hypothetical protein